MHHIEAVVAIRVVLLHDDFELGIADAAALMGECLGRSGAQMEHRNTTLGDHTMLAKARHKSF